MNDLIWKKGKPKIHGWYWMCEDGFLHEPSCFDIQFMWPDIKDEKIVNLSCEKDAWFDNKNWYDNFWFAGPIPKPKRH